MLAVGAVVSEMPRRAHEGGDRKSGSLVQVKIHLLVSVGPGQAQGLFTH